jgi:two-component system sensor histidine kinase/response regulator
MARHILVVDDARVSRLLTQRVLERLGFEVVVVDDGREAVEAHAAGHFDAIVMDCQMPHMDGFQATAAIRRQEAGSDSAVTPIVGLSARDMDGDREVAIAKGMDAYITKPVSAKKMRVALEKLGLDIDDDGRPPAELG